MQVVRAVSLSVPLQSTCGVWRKKPDVSRLVPEHRRLRVGNAGEDIHARVRTYLGASHVFDQELYALAGIECPAEGRARAIAERYRNFDIVFPQGSFDPDVDRTLADTAVREFLEETGISLASLGLHRSVPISPWSDGAMCYASSLMFREHLAVEASLPALKFLGITTAGNGAEGMALYLVQFPSTMPAGQSPRDGFCCGPPRQLLTETDLLHVYTHTASHFVRLSDDERRVALETLDSADLAHKYEALRRYQLQEWHAGPEEEEEDAVVVSKRKSSIPPVAELSATRRRSKRRSSSRMSIDNGDDIISTFAQVSSSNPAKRDKKKKKKKRSPSPAFSFASQRSMQNPFALLLCASS
jgi:8-oxo-dGTP pyrophosphatase MutT (NUDIX family)